MSTSYEYFAPSFDFPAGKQIIGIHVYGFSPRVLKKSPEGHARQAKEWNYKDRRCLPAKP